MLNYKGNELGKGLIDISQYTHKGSQLESLMDIIVHGSITTATIDNNMTRTKVPIASALVYGVLRELSGQLKVGKFETYTLDKLRSITGIYSVETLVSSEKVVHFQKEEIYEVSLGHLLSNVAARIKHNELIKVLSAVITVSSYNEKW